MVLVDEKVLVEVKMLYEVYKYESKIKKKCTLLALLQLKNCHHK